MKVEIDGTIRSSTNRLGNPITVDSRQYLTINGPYLILVTPDRQKVLGEFDYVIKNGYDQSQFSQGKVDLINRGIIQLQEMMRK